VITFVPDPDFHGTVEVPYRVCFTDDACDEGIVTIVVENVNDDPTAAPDLATTPEDSSVAVDVVLNDSDVDGDALTIVDARAVDHPNHSLSGAGISIDDQQIVVEPQVDQWGSLLIQYTIADAAGATASSTLIVDVTPVNDPPEAVADRLTAYENTQVDLDVLANDTDVDGDTLTIVTVTDVTGGAATTDGSTVTFVPHPRYIGPAGFAYTVTDGTTTATANADVTIVDVTATPLVENDTATVNEGQLASVDVLANDIALATALNPGTVVVISPPENGDATWDGTVVRYTPHADWSGQDTFRYLVCDYLEFCNAASATITINPVNDVPSFVSGPSQAVFEDPGPQAVSGWATAISPGPGDEATQTVAFNVTTSDPTLFTVPPVVDPSGRLTYTPAPDGNGTATVTVELVDDGGTANGGVDTTAPTTTTITINPVNDDPVAVDDGLAIAEDNTVGVTFDVLTNDSDIDGDIVQYGSANTSTVVNGTITDNLDGTFTYLPDEHFSGTDTFTYTAIDGNGGNDVATVTITVNPLPDAPAANPDARITAVDTPLSVPAPGLLVNDYDVDNESLTVTTTPITPPTNGAIILNPDGSYTYTPGPGYVGTDSFAYEISDPGGLTSTTTVTITVDSGVVNQTYYLGDAGSAAWDYDLITTPPPSSAPVFDSDGDTYPGLGIDNSDGSQGETDPRKYQLWSLTAGSPVALDGPVTLDLWSTVKNYDLNETSHPFVYLYDCLGVSCTLLAQTDVHTGNWNQGVANFSNRQIDLGSVTHTVAVGRDLVVRLQFKHEDMWIAMTADYPSALELTLANQAPVANNDTAAMNEDDPTANLTVLTNDIDTDIDPVSVAVTVPAGAGTATAVGDGTIDYSPNPNSNGVDTFTYRVCDLGGNCDTATVTVTVTAVNDEPSFTGGGAVAVGLGPNTLLAWATAQSPGPADEAGQTLSFVIAANDNPGLFTTGPTIDATTGDLTFDAVTTGVANITIELVDNGGTANGGDDTSATYFFTITIS